MRSAAWRILRVVLITLAATKALESPRQAFADIPAGGALPDARVGIGSGPSAEFIAGEPAPQGSVKVTSSRGWIDLPPVTLSSTSDWAIFVATVAAPDNASGTVLSIAAPSDHVFTSAGHIALTWCGNRAGHSPWSSLHYGRTFVLTGKDEAGTSVSRRLTSGSFFSAKGVSPLVSHQAFGDRGTHGLIIQRRGGVVELWSVDATGPRLMDSGDATAKFTGITDKPFRVGASHLVAPPSGPSTYWKQPIQGLVVYNGGTLTPIQMQRLYNGTHAKSVLELQASRDDRYYPGVIENGVLKEMVAGKHGTFSGTVAAGQTILPIRVTDDVIVDMDGGGQVLPRDPPPAMTTNVRFWGTRIGPTTDIRMRVITSGTGTAAHPQTSGTVVVGWTTVATDVGHGQAWIGEIPGVPNGFGEYVCEVSWKDVAGQWNIGKRVNRRWCLGVVATIAGQSIVQEARSMGGSPKLEFSPGMQGFMRAFYDIAQNAAHNQDHSQVQGWVTRPNATNQQWGENRMADRLGSITQAPVGISNCAVSGSPVNPYLGEDKERWIRWKRFIQRARPQVIIWGNGHGDQVGREVRFDMLDQLLAQCDQAVRQAPGGPWNYQFYVFPVNGNTRKSNLDSIRSHDIEWAASRAAQGKPVGVLCEVLEGKTKDGVHLEPSDQGHGLLASRMAQTISHAVGSASFSGRGPQVDRAHSSWTSDGATTTIDLPVIQNGGTALVTGSGGPPSGFKVRVDGGPAQSPDARIINPTLVRLTVPTAAAHTVAVTYQAGRPGSAFGDDSATAAAITRAQTGTDNAIYDDRGDITAPTTGIPGFPMPPITAADPLVMTQVR